MSRAGRRLVALPLAALLALAPLSAAAQSPADVAAARELFVEASRLAQQGDWAAAREKFERSLALKRAPITLYSLGVAQKETKRFVDALETLRAFLLEPSTAGTKQYEQPARDAIAELEKRVARLEIQVAPRDAPGLTVKVDGVAVPVAALDHPRLVDPGPHEVVVTASGFQEARRTASPGEGERAPIAVELQPAAAAPPPAPAPPQAAPPPLRPAPAPARDAPARDAPEAPSRVLPIVLIAGGAVAAGVGVTVGLLGVSKASDAPTKDGDEASAARTQALVGDIVTGVGVAAAAAGVLVFALQPSAPAPAAAGASAWIGPGSAGLRLRF